MPIPDYQSIMRPLLAVLGDSQPHQIAELYDQMAITFALTPDEINERLPSGKQTVMRNRVGWARTYLHKAGLLELPGKGLTRITERGVQALKECPERIDNGYLKRFEEFNLFASPGKTEQQNTLPFQVTAQSSVTPDEQIANAYLALNKSLGDEILTAIKSASASFFEQVVVDLMLAMGYGGSREEAGKATQKTNDDGIDGIIKEDRLGLDIIYLQAKRWQNTVHRPEIDKFIGSLTRHRARKGVFITTSSFSDGARDAVRTLDMKVVLIDGSQLAELMIEHSLGVTRKEVYEIKQLDSDYFSEDN